MLKVAILFLLIALVTAVLGFGMIVGVAALLFKICFVLFLVLGLVLVFAGRKTT
jgi:uncharacterized membrane protein YtjA (UPF0391 family)